MAFVTNEEATYISTILSSRPSHTVVENVLENLCSLYRHGKVFRDARSLKSALAGLLSLTDNQPKIIRWTLNAITLVCHKRGSEFVEPISAVAVKYSSDNEILCAVVSALFSIMGEDKAYPLLKKLDVPLSGAILVAAAPYSQKCGEQLRKIRININKAPAVELQHAAILIGTNKAPEYFFEPQHSNKEVIGALNLHDNRLVVQYSIWAIAENPNMNIDDMRLKLANIDSEVEGVRRWIYQLMTKNVARAVKYRELIENGAKDSHRPVREGLATGLRNVYFEGLELIIMDWYSHESDKEIKALLDDHMAANSDKCRSYHDAALDFYKSLPRRSNERLRLEIAASKTALYNSLKKHNVQEDAGLFGFQLLLPNPSTNGVVIVNQTINNSGNMYGVSATGNVSLENFTINTDNPDLHKILLKLVDEIKQKSLSAEQQTQVAALIQAAAKSPSKTTFETLFGWAEKAHTALWLKASLLAFLSNG